MVPSRPARCFSADYYYYYYYYCYCFFIIVNVQVLVSGSLDRETAAVHELVILGVDRPPDSPPLTGTATLTVLVQDVNDNRPVFVPPDYRVRLLEDLPAGTVVGTAVARDRDAGDNAAVCYSIAAGDDDRHFVIDRLTGVVRLSRPVRFSEREMFNVTVRARDRGAPLSLSASTTMLVDVVPVDRNLAAPRFRDAVLQGRVRENQPAGTSVMQVPAADLDATDNPAAAPADYHVVYSIRNGTGLGRFTIDSKGTRRFLLRYTRLTSLCPGLPR